MEEEIYGWAIRQAADGNSVRADFRKRTLRVNGKFVSLKGRPLGIGHYDSLDAWLDHVEDLYDAYKYSRPTKNASARERKAKFKALSAGGLVRECGHNALNNPTSRDEAQAALEVFILLSLIDGSFRPDELFSKDWFYQGADKSFILRRDWF